MVERERFRILKIQNGRQICIKTLQVQILHSTVRGGHLFSRPIAAIQLLVLYCITVLLTVLLSALMECKWFCGVKQNIDAVSFAVAVAAALKCREKIHFMSFFSTYVVTRNSTNAWRSSFRFFSLTSSFASVYVVISCLCFRAMRCGSLGQLLTVMKML